MTRPRVIYLHGFASGPGSKKARAFREGFAARGWEVEVPDLNPRDFRDLTVGGMVDTVSKLLDRPAEPAALIGSSLGGYLASLVASRTGRVSALVLLAPAFELRERWSERLGPDALEAWKRIGTIGIYHHGRDAEEPLGYRFYEESGAYPAYPDVGDVPALVFHGRRDEVIPASAAERFAGGRPNVTLRLLDDEHDLLASAPGIVEESFEFLRSARSRPGSSTSRG